MGENPVGNFITLPHYFSLGSHCPLWEFQVQAKRGPTQETDTAVMVRFTSVPQEIQSFFDAVERRFEYHVINRSVQL